MPPTGCMLESRVLGPFGLRLSPLWHRPLGSGALSRLWRRCLAPQPGGTQHKLRRASASGLRGEDEFSRPSTTRAAAPSSRVSGVELNVDALDDMVINCILTVPAVEHGADSLYNIDSSWVLDDSRCGIRR